VGFSFTDDMEKSSAKHWSIWAGGTHLAAGAAALIGGLIVAYFSFKTLFVSMALIDVVATILAWGEAPADDTSPALQIPGEAPEAAHSVRDLSR